MINFLRIINNIKLGDYLHYDGTINDRASSDVIGVCVIPSNTLPDKYARFMSLSKAVGPWASIMFSLKEYNQKYSYPVDGDRYLSPYDKNGSFNQDFLGDVFDGNIFQEYMGYENTKIYKEKNRDLERIDVFTKCFDIAPSYRKNDWYLPSIGELAFIPPRSKIIDDKLQKAIDVGSPGEVNEFSGYFWSSSERDKSMAWSLNLMDYNAFDQFYVGCAKKDYNGNFIRTFLAL